ncbi:MAG: peptidylprolyl isomerase [Candidatus Delongbacteria bacterium]|nr:peptidylprolyl isomerase [Candidatus Delongbacteria bacterium]
MKSVIYILIAILFYASSTRCEIIDRISAVVGDEIILQSEVYQLVEHQKYMLSGNYNKAELRQMVLDELVSAKILYDVALKDTTITVEDEEVERILDDRINSVLERVGGEKNLQEQYNTTVSKLKKEYRTEIRKTLFVDKLKNRKLQKIDVSRKEIEDFYNNFKDSIPEVKSTISLSQLVINSSDESLALQKVFQKLKAIKEEIISGKITFEEAAEKYSQDPASAKNGGELGITSRGDLVTEYEISAYNLNEGDISEPVRTAFGYHLIRLNKKIGEKINTSHILIKATQDEADDDAAKNKALLVKDSIMNKYMTFEEAVKKYSSDPVSKAKNGRIGILKTDDLDPKYQDIFSDSKIGFISDPLKQNDGYYVYKVIDKQSAHKVDLKTDYSMLKNLASDRKRQEVMKKWIEELKEKVYIEIK